MASLTNTETSLEVIDDVELSLKGMTFLLNNDWENAKALFEQYKDDSPLMCAGDSFVTFLRALMSFEEEQLQQASKVMQDTKKKCLHSKSFTMSRLKKQQAKKNKNGAELEDKLQRQIIIADCVINQAVLTFLNQDISSYIKGGWMLRKAYNMYDKLYKQIKKIQNKYKPRETASAGNLSYSSEVEQAQEATDILDQSETDNESANDVDSDSIQIDIEIKDGTLSKETLDRLHGAVSFGYGCFQLAISLIPTKILKIVEFLGFEGDRDTGLSALQVASNSRDMKAPIASLGLIWYHTVIRPFFALDGNAVAIGVEDAYRELEKSEARYPNSALFLFFKGRAQRLTCELDAALQTYNAAFSSARGQREIELMLFHEIGWINLMQMNWSECRRCFSNLKDESRWSKSFYAFLTGICVGATGDVTKARVLFAESPQLVRRKNNQIEAFVIKRAERILKDGGEMVTKEYCIFMGLEILYLWNTLSQCTAHGKQRMITVCEETSEQSMFHLRDLIAGALYNQAGQLQKSKQSFRSAISRQEELSKAGNKYDTHVAAFAMYELGIMLAADPATYSEGRDMLVQARDGFKEYDFDNRLSVRINAALRRLHHDGTPL